MVQSATGTTFLQPDGVAIDGAGNLYISDQQLMQVVEVQATTGNLIVVAGTLGGGSDGGLSGPALSAALNVPSAIAADASGNLYFADSGNDVIRKVDTQGTISVIAGTYETANYSGDNGVATSATLNNPTDIALDSAGNLYIADGGNNVVREVNLSSGIITTIAGVNASPCTSSTSACGDGGPATAAQFNNPGAIAVDAGGNIYIADGGDRRIREINAQSRIITTIAGNGGRCNGATFPCGDGGIATSAVLGNSTPSIRIDGGGNIFLTDAVNSAVREVNVRSGTITTIAGTLGTTGFSGDGGIATSARLSSPQIIALDSFGNLYVADQGNFVVRGVTGVGSVPLATQTITFNALPNVTYGVAPSTLTGTVDSGLPVTYTVSGCTTCATVSTSGSSSILTITGATSAGATVTVTATQPGNAQFSAATPVAQSFTVAQAALTVTAPSISLTSGEAVPTLAPNFSGFVNGDTGTGAPVMTVSDANGNIYAAGSIPPVGSYTITITQGNFAAGPNYAVQFVNGSLTVTGGTAQTVTFNALPNPMVQRLCHSSQQRVRVFPLSLRLPGQPCLWINIIRYWSWHGFRDRITGRQRKLCCGFGIAQLPGITSSADRVSNECIPQLQHGESSFYVWHYGICKQ